MWLYRLAASRPRFEAIILIEVALNPFFLKSFAADSKICSFLTEFLPKNFLKNKDYYLPEPILKIIEKYAGLSSKLVFDILLRH